MAVEGARSWISPTRENGEGTSGASFKQRRANQSTPPAAAPTEPTVQDEKKSIDEEIFDVCSA
jgi:hypothetical protein